MEKILIGIITKPQALKGQFRVKPKIHELKKFKNLKNVFIQNQSFEVENVILRENFAILKVKGIDTCDQAENLRNEHLYAEIEIENSNNFDFLNYEVQIENTKGLIIEINNFGSKDIFTIQADSKICMLPVVDGLVESVDEKNKKLILNKQIYDQVVVYEN